MTAERDLETLLHELIPLSRAMGVRVAALEPERLRLSAPLALNHNHSDTGFAGSQYALAALCGWAMLRQLVDRHGIAAELVLGTGQIRYNRPLTGDLVAEVTLPLAEQERVIGLLRNGSKARLELEIGLPPEDPAARFTGLYFARPG